MADTNDPEPLDERAPSPREPAATRDAARQGLRRGLRSLAVSLFVYVVGLAVLFPVLVGRRLPRSYGEFVRTWRLNLRNPLNFYWPRDLTRAGVDVSEQLPASPFFGESLVPSISAILGALVLAAVLVAILAGLERAPRLGRIGRYFQGHLLGAVPPFVIAVFAFLEVFDLERASLVTAIAVGIVLAGFGARVLLRNRSLRACTRDAGTVVDAWLAVVFLLVTVLAVQQHLGVLLGEWWWASGVDSHPTFAFTTAAFFVVPALVLAVVRDVGWSVARSRRASEADASGGSIADGGTRSGEPRSATPSSGAAPSRSLRSVLRGDRRARLGGLLLVPVALFAITYGWRIPDFSPSDIPSDGGLAVFSWFSLFPVGHHALFGLMAATIAIAFGLLPTRALAETDHRGTLESICLDPIAGVGQFPVLFYLAIYVPEHVGSQSGSEFVFSLALLSVLGGLALAPLVARVAGDELERGRPWRRAAIRGSGVALSGAAVLALSFTWLVYEARYLSYFQYYDVAGYRLVIVAFAVATTVPLFLLGEGLRSVARSEPAGDAGARS